MNQVYELHRVYNRQKELMDQTKRREPNGCHLQFQAEEQSQLLSQTRVDVRQKTSRSLCRSTINTLGSKLPMPTAHNFQEASDSVAGKSIQSHPNPSSGETIFGEYKVRSSNGIGSGKRVLDLELPANVYNSSEQKIEPSREENAAEGPEYNPKRHVPEFMALMDSKSYTILTQDTSSSSQSCKKPKFLVDLNEPLPLDGSATPNSTTLPYNFETGVPPASQLPSCRERPFACTEGATLGSKSSGSSDFLFVDNAKVSYLHMSSPHLLVPEVETPVNSGSTFPVSSQRKYISNIRQIPIAVQALPCFNTSESLIKNFNSYVRNSWPNENKFDLDRPISSVGSSFNCTGNHKPTMKVCAFANCSEASDRIGTLKGLDLNVPPPTAQLDEVIHLGNVGTAVDQDRIGESGRSLSSSKNSDDKAEIIGPPNSFKAQSFSDKSFSRTGVSRHCNPSLDSNTENSGKHDRNDVLKECGLQVKLHGKELSFDLNSCVDEGENSEASPTPGDITKTGFKRDFESLLCPENMEYCPPRGESNDNQLEKPIHLSDQMNGEPQEEVDIAAETIISLSASAVHQCLDIASSELSDASRDRLSWFAGIVSCIASDKENEFNELFCGLQFTDIKKISPSIDNFDVKRLNLEDTGFEDCPSSADICREEVNGDFVFPHQTMSPRRVWGHKDIEGLRMAKGAQTRSPKIRRKISRIDSMGRTRSISLPIAVVEAVRSPLEQRDFLKGWGKTSRRRRAPRARVSNLIV